MQEIFANSRKFAKFANISCTQIFGVIQYPALWEVWLVVGEGAFVSNVDRFTSYLFFFDSTSICCCCCFVFV